MNVILIFDTSHLRVMWLIKAYSRHRTVINFTVIISFVSETVTVDITLYKNSVFSLTQVPNDGFANTSYINEYIHVTGILFSMVGSATISPKPLYCASVLSKQCRPMLCAVG